MTRVAAAQFAGGYDVDRNIERIERLATEAADRGARVVVFPEASTYAWDAPAADLRAVAEESGSVTRRLVDIATSAGITLVAGMFAPATGSRPVNRLVVASARGTLTSYDKVHLYDAFNYRESDRVAPGPTCDDHEELGIFLEGQWTFGLLNCYDLRFPEMARLLIDRGVDVLVVSSAWVAGPHKEMHWETLLRARAIENTCYVVAAAQPPPASTGLSMIVDPLGLACVTCTRHEDLALHDLDPAHLQQVRDLVPSLQHRRYTNAAAAPARQAQTRNRSSSPVGRAP